MAGGVGALENDLSAGRRFEIRMTENKRGQVSPLPIAWSHIKNKKMEKTECHFQVLESSVDICFKDIFIKLSLPTDL